MSSKQFNFDPDLLNAKMHSRYASTLLAQMTESTTGSSFSELRAFLGITRLYARSSELRSKLMPVVGLKLY